MPKGLSISRDAVTRGHNPVVADAARNFLEAAERAWFYMTDEVPRTNGSCVYAAQHNAVLACELFLKAFDAVNVYTSAGEIAEGNNKPAFDKVYLLQSHVACDADTVPLSGKYDQLTGHDGLLSALPDDAQELLREELSHDDRAVLDKLTPHLLASRYPWELAQRDNGQTATVWETYGNPERWILIARDLCRLEQDWRQRRFIS